MRIKYWLAAGKATKVQCASRGINIGWLLPLAVMAELWRSWEHCFL